jgi:uncharacterized protein YqeY
MNKITKNLETSDEIKNQVIYLYQNTNISIMDIGKHIGYHSKDKVYEILSQKSVPKRRSVKNKFSECQKQEIIDSYKNYLEDCK